MKYETLPQFTADYNGLSSGEREKFKEFLRAFIPACDEYAANNGNYRWPARFRFEHLTATKGICAVTWSFAGPDGRATFHFKTVDGEMYLVWRRVGRHKIYSNP